MKIKLRGADVNVIKKGNGEPALLIHGVPDSADIWNSVIEKLETKFTCFAPDLPGFNLSDMPNDFEFELKAYGQYINELVEALGIEKPLTLILHDWGGIFGMSFACQYPEKIKRIVGGSFPFSPHYQWHAWARVWRTPLLGELSLAAMNRPLFHWEMKRSGSRVSKEHIDQSYNKINSLTKRTILGLYRSASPRKFEVFSPLIERLTETVPIDCVWGQDDKYVPETVASYLKPRTSKALENCGHWVPVEAPNAIAELLLSSNTSLAN